jgi:hypothetical protein
MLLAIVGEFGVWGKVCKKGSEETGLRDTKLSETADAGYSVMAGLRKAGGYPSGCVMGKPQTICTSAQRIM